jgi:hypothetical protein
VRPRSGCSSDSGRRGRHRKSSRDYWAGGFGLGLGWNLNLKRCA